MSISFFTAVSYGGVYKTRSEYLLEKVDDYFYLGGRKALVIRGHSIGKSEGVSMVKTSAMYTTLKKVSYLTLLIPVIALAAKAILRSYHKFHLIRKSNVPVLNAAPQSNGNIPPKNNDDPAPPPYSPPVSPIGRRSNDGPVPPSSPAPDFAYDSSILSEPVPPSTPPPVDLLDPIRPPSTQPDDKVDHNIDDLPSYAQALAQDIAFDVPTRLTAEKMADLKIIPTSQQQFDGPVPGTSYQSGKGFSSLKEFKDSVFEWKYGIPEEVCCDDLLQGMVIKRPFEYEVTRRKLERNYPELPVNTPVELPPEAHDKLELTLKSFKNGICSGTSEIEEYQNSQIMWREVEDGGQGCIYTRTLKAHKPL